MLTIGNGDATCTIYPELGGGLRGWTVARQNMLRTADAAAIASGILFPWCPIQTATVAGSLNGTHSRSS